MRLNFKEIEQEIKERRKEIEVLMAQHSQRLAGDENLQNVVGQNRMDEAAKIQENIFALTEENDFNKALLIRAREINQNYIQKGLFAPDPNVLDLEKAKELAKEKLDFLSNDREARDEIENQILCIEKAEEELEGFCQDFWREYFGVIGYEIVELKSLNFPFPIEIISRV